MRRDDGRAGSGCGPEIAGVAEAAHVVAEYGADGESGPGDRGSGGVHRDRHVEPGRHRRDGLGDQVGLLGLGDLLDADPTGPGADVEQVRAVVDELVRAAQQGVEAPVCVAVVEGVAGAVEDAHHQEEAVTSSGAGTSVVELLIVTPPLVRMPGRPSSADVLIAAEPSGWQVRVVG
jgi:hypothetical protein